MLALSWYISLKYECEYTPCSHLHFVGLPLDHCWSGGFSLVEDTKKAPRRAFNVEILARQLCFRFSYVGYDVVFKAMNVGVHW